MTVPDGLRPAARDDLSALPVEVAPTLLGAHLVVEVGGDRVVARLTEVEAYHGAGTGDVPDPGSHARSGRSPRNATMWGEPGHLYVYLSHGIHSCVNVVCAPAGVAGGVLLRAAEIVEGTEIATRRRFAAREPGPVRDLARGPGRLGQCLGLRHAEHDGVDAVTGAEQSGAVALLLLREQPVTSVATGPRVGVAGVAGTDAYPWRFWIPGDPTVSAFRWGRGAQGARAAAVLD
ncbi:DNA-3-methyladenine glycosylase [Microbacterium schleiferi]|uniref:DNA-3-methyladenine glycosylase n=1 Tax=Microbacterium schleiferi TaxID=69362 RepID=UPI001D1704FA|nr:DNA-3-methyladenine glycosylase [Microbacterium schleiferi]MCC4268996.1 DNA-3-methyladenine glycosylase [Microbacterium schleiferi]